MKFFVKKQKMTKAFTHGSTDKTVCLNYYLFQHKILMEKKPKNDCCTINENTVFSYRFSPIFDQLLNLTLIVISPQKTLYDVHLFRFER